MRPPFTNLGAYDLGLHVTDSGGALDTVRTQIAVLTSDPEHPDEDEDEDKDKDKGKDKREDQEADQDPDQDEDADADKEDADPDPDADPDADPDQDADQDTHQETDTPPADPTDRPTPRRPRAMSPVPVVRIAGTVLPRGAVVRILSVSAPRGAHVRVTCAGRGCPDGSVATTSAATRVVRFRKFERRLPAGIRLRLFVRQKNRIGKYTSFLIRAGAPPKRVDRCLVPGRGPRRCP